MGASTWASSHDDDGDPIFAALVPTQLALTGPPKMSWAEQTWESLAKDEVFMRDVVQAVVAGHSYREIHAQYDGMSWSTMMQVALEVPRYMMAETKAMVESWLSVTMQRMERITVRYMRELDPEDQPLAPIDTKLSMAFSRHISVCVALLDRLKAMEAQWDPEPVEGEHDVAYVVHEYQRLVTKMYAGVIASGYVRNEADADYESDEEDDEMLDARADNSDTIADALVLDPAGAATEADLDSAPGEWRDGKWYPMEKAE